VNVGGFEFGELRVAGGAVEQDRRQWIGEVIGDEAVGAVTFASRPVAGGEVGVGDGVPQSVVEPVVDRRQQTALRSEMVVQGAGAEPGAAHQPAEFDDTVFLDEFVTGSVE